MHEANALRYKLTRSCFCVPDFVGPFIITVENGKVTDAEFEDPTGVPGVPVPTDLPTISELFVIILVSRGPFSALRCGIEG